MPQFAQGQAVPTIVGEPAVIERFLAEGGQGEVYIVNFMGRKLALKWYKKNKMAHPDRFYANLIANVQNGPPDPAFLWPITATQKVFDSFGYLMELRKPEYHELSEFMLPSVTKIRFPSFRTAVDACLKIVRGYRVLHNRGYSYQDINDGNFFIDPDTGDVLICDCDNVAPNQTDTFILGTPRYMAPEVVTGKSKPNVYTDRFSMAVVLFFLLCMNHPLEGRRWLVPCLTPALERKLYGSDPLFIFDESNDANRPVKGIHNNCLNRWSYLPDYMKDIFSKAFSRQALTEPERRPSELDFMKALVRFRSDIATCPYCRGEVFIQNASTTPCDICGKDYPIRNRFKMPGYDVSAVRGTTVYRCQMGFCNADSALDEIGVVLQNAQGQMAFRNTGSETIIGYTADGTPHPIAPNKLVPVKAGIRIEACGGEFTII